MLSGPNLAHCWRDDEDLQSGATAPCAFQDWIVIQFDGACFGSEMLDLPEAARIRDLLKDAARGAAFTNEVSTLVIPMMLHLIKREGMLRLIGLLELLEILANAPRRLLATNCYVASHQVDNQWLQRLEAIQNYIAARFRGTISQAEIAQQLEMSSATLSKFVRAATGETFTDMVRIARINEACRLLTHSNDRITDIALDCGFQHTSHFDRQFKNLKKVSPTEYRRRMKQMLRED